MVKNLCENPCQQTATLVCVCDQHKHDIQHSSPSWCHAVGRKVFRRISFLAFFAYTDTSKESPPASPPYCCLFPCYVQHPHLYPCKQSSPTTCFSARCTRAGGKTGRGVARDHCASRRGTCSRGTGFSTRRKAQVRYQHRHERLGTDAASLLVPAEICTGCCLHLWLLRWRYFEARRMCHHTTGVVLQRCYSAAKRTNSKQRFLAEKVLVRFPTVSAVQNR